jgi:hypothetical protein
VAPEEQRIKHLEILNGLLREQAVRGNVLYHDQFPDVRFHGYWYTNPSSRGFLGKTLAEAREALDILIASVKSAQTYEKQKGSWLEKLKSL